MSLKQLQLQKHTSEHKFTVDTALCAKVTSHLTIYHQTIIKLKVTHHLSVLPLVKLSLTLALTVKQMAASPSPTCQCVNRHKP